MTDQENEDFKRTVESMIDSLKKSGVNVKEAAILNFDKDTPDELIDKSIGESLRKTYGDKVQKMEKPEFEKPSEKKQLPAAELQRLNDFISETIKNKKDDLKKLMNDSIAKTIQEAKIKEDPGGKKEVCYCPNCFNFNTFESVLSQTPGGEFHYAGFKVGGKDFVVKYWRNEEIGKEQLMIMPKEDYKLTEAELLPLLNKAIEQGNFKIAQEIAQKLAEINKTK